MTGSSKQRNPSVRGRSSVFAGTEIGQRAGRRNPASINARRRMRDDVSSTKTNCLCNGRGDEAVLNSIHALLDCEGIVAVPTLRPRHLSILLQYLVYKIPESVRFN